MKAIDFFCGAGGLTRGLLDAGIDVRAGIDADERCRESYENNNSPSTFVHHDVSSLSASAIRKLIKGATQSSLLFAGCAPCQSFSKQRTSRSPRADSTLLITFAEIIAEFLPGFVIMENVPGIRKVRGYSAYRRFVRTLEQNGYKFDDAVLDAKHYGVPQTRRRYLLIASRFGRIDLPVAEYGPQGEEFLTVRDFIAHYPRIRAGQKHPRIANHQSAALSELNLERLRHTRRNGGDRRDWPNHLKLKCHSGDYDGHTDVYGRMRWDEPSPALTGRCNSLSNGRYGHPTQNRAISLREAASLQSFCDDYEFFGSFQHIAQQIGNAVPVQLAYALGRAVVDH